MKTAKTSAKRQAPRAILAVAMSVALGAAALAGTSPVLAGFIGNHNETLLHDES